MVSDYGVAIFTYARYQDQNRGECSRGEGVRGLSLRKAVVGGDRFGGESAAGLWSS